MVRQVQGYPERKGAGQEDEDTSLYETEAQKRIYLNIRRNMKRLCTFYNYKDRGITNTNNGLEAVSADIKSKVRIHSKLTRKH